MATAIQHLMIIGLLASALGILFGWAFRHLPREQWQVFGVIPVCKDRDGSWQGLNLTYYGVINGCAVAGALSVAFVLLAAVGMSTPAIGFTLGGVLLLVAPSAKWVARLVEKKRHTLTIGGASFFGLVGTPLLLWLLQPAVSRWTSVELPLLPIISAMAIGYALGEGIGRLACLSFGCCYGKPIEEFGPFLRYLSTPFHVVFHGATKKAAYAGGLDGRPLLAIQSITSVLSTMSALAGVYLYLEGHFESAYLVCLLVTQTWRIVSEFARADYRGAGHISAYQYMAAIAALVGVVYAMVLPAVPFQVDLVRGLRALWDPAVIIGGQFVWIGVFLFTGRSRTTAARLSLFVRTDRI